MLIGTLVTAFLILILGIAIYSVGGWGVNYTFTGAIMVKYKVIAYLVKIAITVAIGYFILPYYKAIAAHVNDNLQGIIDYWFILKNCGLMVLIAVGGILTEMFFAFVILMPTIKRIHFNN